MNLASKGVNFLACNHSTITDAMQAKGAVYYATLWGYNILKRTCKAEEWLKQNSFMLLAG